MAREIIDIGTAGNDGTGDDLRSGGTKINNNFQELYSDVASLQVQVGGSGGGVDGIGFIDRGILFEGDSPDDAFQTFFGVVNPTADRTIKLPDDSGTVALITDIKQEIDSSYISLLTGTAFDSSGTLILIQENSVDSAEVLQLIDSGYINFRVNAPDLTAHAGNIVPAADSTYDLGDSNYQWKDLWLSGKTIHLGGQTISNNGSSFVFSQELATGANNMSVDSGNGFFVNTYANIATGTRAGGYGTQQNSMKIEGNTVQFATVDGIVSAELVTNQGLSNFNDPFGAGGAISVPDITTAQRSTVAARSEFRVGSIAYNTDSNNFNLYDSDGWFSLNKNAIEADDISTTVDSGYVKARATELDLNNYTVSSVPAGQHGKFIFVTDGASGNPCLAVYDSDAGFYKRITLGTQIST